MGDDDAMAAEFDTVAEWSAEAAVSLGREHYVPAGCRGSGSPAALDWLLERLDVEHGSVLLDVGAGVGGAAAYAVAQVGARAVLLEPAAGACRAARRLFALPTARADATALPVADASVRTLWCLGVLCTMDDQLAMLRELRRVLSPDGRAGLLIFVAAEPDPDGEPADNDFPTRVELAGQLRAAGLTVADETTESRLAKIPNDWQARADAVESEVARRHGEHPAWRQAQEQSGAIGRLISDGAVGGHLVVVHPSSAGGR